MATRVDEKPASRTEAFVEATLDRARSRVRLLDLAAGGFGLAAALLGFLCAMAILDQTFVLSASTRQFALLVFLASVGTYAWFAIVQPLRSEVNPHYAARLVERELPGEGRNHVVNWIDLRGVKLPTAFRASLNARAARDMQKADLEKAISARYAWTTSGLFVAMLGLFVGLFILFGPRPFASLMGRAAVPFGAGRIASRTQVAIVKPGNATVTVGMPVTIVASVTGRVPGAEDRDAPALLYRHDEDESYRRRPLARHEVTGEWTATVGPQDVAGGFTYHVTAGDGRTNEHRITTRAAPLISGFLVHHHYRPYVGKADRTTTARKIDDLRGTDVTITIKSNRSIKDARLEYEAGGSERGEVILSDNRAARFKFTLDQRGRYRLGYTTPEGETYRDADWSEIAVQPDEPPVVRLTIPGKDIAAPGNGTVEIEGVAADDIGIARMELHLQVAGGEKLPVRPFLADKLGKPGFGTPRTLEYRAALPLADLGQKPGTVIEYWLEASDACDFPKPNTSASEKFRITLEGPGDAAASKKEEQAAKEREEKHRKEQEEKAKKEQAARDEQRNKEEKQEKEDQARRDQEAKGGKEGKEDPKKDGKEGKPEPKEGGKDGDGKKDTDTEKTAKDLQDKLDKRDRERGKGKEDDKPKGEGKGAGEKPGEAKPAKGDDKPGEGKDPGEKGKDEKPGESKDGKDGKDDAKGEGKPAGKEGDKTGEAKPGAGSKEPKGEGKPGGKGGESSGKGKGDGNPAEGKGQGGGAAPGESKGEGRDPGEGQPGESKGEGGKGSEGEAKAGAGKGEGKSGAGKGPGTGEGKPAGQPDGTPAPGQGKGNPGEGGIGGGEGAPQPSGKPEKPRPSRAVMLQLEDLRKNIDANILKDAKMSREQFEKFLRDLEELARRREKAEREEAVRGEASTLPSTVGSATPPTPGGKGDDLRGTGRPKPLKEYEGPRAEFLKLLLKKR